MAHEDGLARPVMRRARVSLSWSLALPPPALRKVRPISKRRMDFACWRALRSADETRPGMMDGRMMA